MILTYQGYLMVNNSHKSRFSEQIGSILLWCVYGVVIIISYFLSESISVNGFIPSEPALNILKSLVDVDIALLTFWGLILVFSLGSLRESKARVEKERYELGIAKDRLVLERSLGCANGVKRIVVDAFTHIEERHEKRAIDLDNQLRQLARQIASTIIGAFIVVVVLLWALLQSSTALGKIGSRGLHFSEVFSCLVFMLMAVFLIFSSLWNSRPMYERRILIEEFEKGWTKLKEDWRKFRKESKMKVAYWQTTLEAKIEPFRRKMENIRKRARQKREHSNQRA